MTGGILGHDAMLVSKCVCLARSWLKKPMYVKTMILKASTLTGAHTHPKKNINPPCRKTKTSIKSEHPTSPAILSDYRIETTVSTQRCHDFIDINGALQKPTGVATCLPLCALTKEKHTSIDSDTCLNMVEHT